MKKIEALIAAGKRATQGEWEISLSPPSPEVRAKNGADLFMAYRDRTTGLLNSDFATQAANARAEIEAMYEENKRLNKLLDAIEQYCEDDHEFVENIRKGRAGETK